MRQLSPVRTQLMYRSAAYLMWKSSNGPLVPGLQNGYAVTCFNNELELRQYVNTYSYSQLIKQCTWKVGTAEITQLRLDRMFKIKRPLLSFVDIWDRYMIPFTDRLSKYAGDTKSLEAGQCSFMRDVLIHKYVVNQGAAVLMLPLVIAYSGKANHLEEEMSEMISKAGGVVHNDKSVQNAKVKQPATDVNIGLDDLKADFPLTITYNLKQMGATTYAEGTQV